MSTVLEDRGPAGSTRTRTRRPSSVPAQRASRSKAAQRALDRRERRTAVAGPAGRTESSARRRLGRIPLVVPVLTLVVGALALTLYLSTKSAQDSYAIDALREQNSSLEARRDAAKREYDLLNSAPELANKADKLGMVPGTAGMQVIVGPDGKTRTVGTLRPSSGGPLPALNPAPNPVDKIDSSKVDDSKGLGGDSGSTTPTTPSSSTPSSTAPAVPSSTAPSATPSLRPNVRPQATTPRNAQPDPRRRVSGPATNVIPSDSATPRPNPTPAR